MGLTLKEIKMKSSTSSTRARHRWHARETMQSKLIQYYNSHYQAHTDNNIIKWPGVHITWNRKQLFVRLNCNVLKISVYIFWSKHFCQNVKYLWPKSKMIWRQCSVIDFCSTKIWLDEVEESRKMIDGHSSLYAHLTIWTYIIHKITFIFL